jgi:hypothetical protein
MRATSKRAIWARWNRGNRKVVLMILTLVLGVTAIGGSWESGAQCSGEAQVSIERNGPNGTFAGDR